MGCKSSGAELFPLPDFTSQISVALLMVLIYFMPCYSIREPRRYYCHSENKRELQASTCSSSIWWCLCWNRAADQGDYESLARVAAAHARSRNLCPPQELPVRKRCDRS